MSQSGTYSQAHQELIRILSKKDYTPVVTRTPWYEHVLTWLWKHTFGLLTQGGILHTGWFLTALAVVIVLLGVLWALRRVRQTASGKLIRDVVRERRMENKLQIAREAKQDGHYDRMLHFLTEVSLETAQSHGWTRIFVHKTAREYRRDLRRKATREFCDMFDELTTRAEQVLFAERELAVDEADAIWRRVERNVAVGTHE